MAYESYLYTAHKKTILKKRLVLSTMMYQCKWKQHSLMAILSFYYFNAKLGFEVIDHDIDPTSKNGEKLLNLYCKYNLTLLNILDFCDGIHARIHRYKSRIGKSILDYVFVSSDLKRILLQCVLMSKSSLRLGATSKAGKDFPTIVPLNPS